MATFKELLAALGEALDEKLGGATAAPKKDKPAAAKKVTLATVKSRATAVLKTPDPKKGKSELKAILEECGASKVPELGTSLYADFVEKCDAILAAREGGDDSEEEEDLLG